MVLMAWVLGWIAPVMVVFAQGALPAFIAQVVIGPVAFYGNASPILRNFIHFGASVLASLVFVGVCALQFRANDRLLNNRRRSFMMGLTLTYAFFLVSVSGLGGDLSLHAWLLETLPWKGTKYVLDAQMAAPAYAAGVAVVVLAAVLLVPDRWRHGLPRPRKDDSRLLVTMMGIGALAGVAPIFDVYHLWWSVPIALVAVALSLVQLSESVRQRELVLAIAAPFLIAGLVLSVAKLGVDRFTVRGGALSGMQVESAQADQVSKLDAMLMGVSPQSAHYRCADGLLATWSGRFQSASPDFVDWAWGVRQNDAAVREFVCVTTSDHDEALQIATANGWVVKADSGLISLQPFFEYVVFEIEPTT